MPAIMQVFCADDYQLATPSLAAAVKSVEVYKAQRFSDHAPVTVDYDSKP